MASNSTKGPKANEESWSHKFKIDLSELNYTTTAGAIDGLQGEESQSMLTGLQPGIANGCFVKNEYRLVMESRFGGCHCCVEYPASTQPMSIVPLVNP